MGNCQAAEAATVVIQHPVNKIERIYWSLSAHQVMSANPGHYVALVVTSPTLKSDNGTPLRQLKLLRPDDTLLIGHVYRLISFEDVLKEFATKKCVKLGKLLKERGGFGVEMRMKDSTAPYPNRSSKSENSNKRNEEEKQVMGESNSGTSNSSSRGGVGGRQWRPALHSISESST